MREWSGLQRPNSRVWQDEGVPTSRAERTIRTDLQNIESQYLEVNLSVRLWIEDDLLTCSEPQLDNVCSAPSHNNLNISNRSGSLMVCVLCMYFILFHDDKTPTWRGSLVLCEVTKIQKIFGSPEIDIFPLISISWTWQLRTFSLYEQVLMNYERSCYETNQKWENWQIFPNKEMKDFPSFVEWVKKTNIKRYFGKILSKTKRTKPRVTKSMTDRLICFQIWCDSVIYQNLKNII